MRGLLDIIRGSRRRSSARWLNYQPRANTAPGDGTIYVQQGSQIIALPHWSDGIVSGCIPLSWSLSPLFYYGQASLQSADYGYVYHHYPLHATVAVPGFNNVAAGYFMHFYPIEAVAIDDFTQTWTGFPMARWTQHVANSRNPQWVNDLVNPPTTFTPWNDPVNDPEPAADWRTGNNSMMLVNAERVTIPAGVSQVTYWVFRTGPVIIDPDPANRPPALGKPLPGGGFRTVNWLYWGELAPDGTPYDDDTVFTAQRDWLEAWLETDPDGIGPFDDVLANSPPMVQVCPPGETPE